MSRWRRPIGVVLAGGAARRMGTPKAAALLDGRPLISYPLRALRLALDEVAVVAKPDCELPKLPGVPLWLEPERPRHPLVGILHALRCARGRPVVVCAVDMPFVSDQLVMALASADPRGAPAVVASLNETIQPLVACYQPQAREVLEPAVSGELPVIDAVLALKPARHEVRDARELFNVNTPQDMRRAAMLLERLRADYPNVKS